MLRGKGVAAFQAASHLLSASDTSFCHRTPLGSESSCLSKIGCGSCSVIVERQYRSSLLEDEIEESQDSRNPEEKEYPWDVKKFLHGRIHYGFTARYSSYTSLMAS